MRKRSAKQKLIDEGDAEANFAYFALIKLHILPSVFAEMEEAEKAFVIAALKTKLAADKKQADELKRKRK